MKAFAGLLLVAILVLAGVWYFGGPSGRSQIRQTGDAISEKTADARDAVRDKLHDLNFNTDDLKDELAKTGQVVREKSTQLGDKVSDATADARTTTTIKGKIVAEPGLSALSISVNTTQGVVTLSGTVKSPEDIKKAMNIALETDGCYKVISTLQVKS